MPRISLGSICGYFIGEYSNSTVLSKMKILTNGKHLWMRTIGSTLIGELLDSIIFVAIAFSGLYAASILMVMALSNYLFKTMIEVVFTPFTYVVVNFVKKHEQLDTYDYGERYSPRP